LSASILYPYLLALAAYSSFVGSMVVNIRVGIKVVVGLKKLGGNKVIRVLKLRLRVRGYIYILYSLRACRVGLSETIVLSCNWYCF